MTERPPVGVSACLVGERVRYDGAHKRQDHLLAHFADLVEWLPVCPEVELGLGVPRETISLRQSPSGLRLIARRSGRDLTDAMQAWAVRRLDELPPLAGFVLKARSPSCGVGTAEIEGADERADGRWAAAVRERRPALPIAQETDLTTPAERDRFLRGVRAAHRLNQLFQPGWTPADLVEFHSANKLLLMAHSPDLAKRLGRLAAQPGQEGLERLYRESFIEALAAPPTPGRESNALAHAFGYFSQDLPAARRRALHQAIEAVAQGRSDVSSLKREMQALAEEHGHAYLARQSYWRADPGR